MDRKKKICLVTFQYPPISRGGVGSAVDRISRHLVRFGIEVHIIAPGKNRLEESITVCEEQGRIVHRTFPSLGKYGGDYSNEAVEFRFIGEYIAQLHESEHFDLIHSFFLVPSGIIAAIASEDLNLPHVLSIRGSDIEVMRYNPILLGTIRWVLERAALVTAGSLDLLKKARNIGTLQDELVIQNSIDPTMFDTRSLSEIGLVTGGTIRVFGKLITDLKSKGHLILGTTSSVRPAKGFMTLIEAYRQIKEQYPFINLLVVGEVARPSYKKKYIKLLKNLNLSQDILITGWVPHSQVLAWMKEMDIFLFPSLQDVFPNAILEAMCCGLSIVSTNVGGLSDLFEDGKDGILVTPGCVEELVSAVSQLIIDDNLRDALGYYSRLKVERDFTPESEAKAWVNVYKRTIVRYKNDNR